MQPMPACLPASNGKTPIAPQAPPLPPHPQQPPQQQQQPDWGGLAVASSPYVLTVLSLDGRAVLWQQANQGGLDPPRGLTTTATAAAADGDGEQGASAGYLGQLLNGQHEPQLVLREVQEQGGWCGTVCVTLDTTMEEDPTTSSDISEDERGGHGAQTQCQQGHALPTAASGSRGAACAPQAGVHADLNLKGAAATQQTCSLPQHGGSMTRTPLLPRLSEDDHSNTAVCRSDAPASVVVGSGLLSADRCEGDRASAQDSLINPSLMQHFAAVRQGEAGISPQLTSLLAGAGGAGGRGGRG